MLRHTGAAGDRSSEVLFTSLIEAEIDVVAVDGHDSTVSAYLRDVDPDVIAGQCELTQVATGLRRAKRVTSAVDGQHQRVAVVATTQGSAAAAFDEGNRDLKVHPAVAYGSVDDLGGIGIKMFQEPRSPQANVPPLVDVDEQTLVLLQAVFWQLADELRHLQASSLGHSIGEVSAP